MSTTDHHLPVPDPETVYAVSCPPWCTGHHPPILAGDAAELPEDLADYDEAVTHERPLVPDETAGLGVDLVSVDVHPTSHVLPAPPHLAVWIDGRPVDTAASADQLRTWAEILTEAADRAEEWLS